MHYISDEEFKWLQRLILGEDNIGNPHGAYTKEQSGIIKMGMMIVLSRLKQNNTIIVE